MGSPDIDSTLGLLLDQVRARLDVDAAAVLLLHPQTRMLEYAAGAGLRRPLGDRPPLPLGVGFAGQAAQERRIVQAPNLAWKPEAFAHDPEMAGESFVSYWAVPLVAKGEVRGVLEVFHRSPLEPDDEWREFLDVLATQAAIAVDSATMFRDLQHSHRELMDAYEATIEGWGRALDLRDQETEGHSRRVTDLAERLARRLGMGEAELVHVRRGSLLHDIGKMGVPDRILLKTDDLSPTEWRLMRKHPQDAYDMLSPIAFLRPALDIPYCHHEKWDGTRLPAGPARRADPPRRPPLRRRGRLGRPALRPPLPRQLARSPRPGPHPQPGRHALRPRRRPRLPRPHGRPGRPHPRRSLRQRPPAPPRAA